MFPIMTIAVLSLAQTDAASSFRTGQDLLALLEDKTAQHAFMEGVAHGYINGVWEMLSSDKVVCSPENATNGQAYAIVIKWLKDNPKDWNQHKAVVVIRALRDAWPCPTK